MRAGIGGATLASYCCLLLLFNPPAQAAETADNSWRKLNVMASANSWRTRGESHGGYQLAIVLRPVERHRLMARHTEVSNDFSNAFSAFRDILTFCDLRSDCDSERTGRTIRETALLYQYQVWGHTHPHSATEIWLGAGPGQIRDVVRDPGIERGAREETGIAWGLSLVARGSRFFTALNIEGNSEINGTMVGLGFGVGF